MNSPVERLERAIGGSVEAHVTPVPKRLSDVGPQVSALREIGSEFHWRGWSVGTSSNYSIVVDRDPVRLLVTASGKDKGRLTGEDFVIVDETGVPTDDAHPKSSAETLLHCLLVRNDPEVGAVLHTHSVWSTVLSQHFAADGGFWIEDFEMLKGLEGVPSHEHREWIDIFDNSQDMHALSAAIDQRFADPDHPRVHGFLLRQHGLYTWGKDIFAARRHIEIYEFLFECVARKIMMKSGRTTPL